MSKYLDEAIKLRARTDRHYNCAQAVFVPFVKDANLDEETAYRIAANFGSGMKMASTCGAITGGLMVLGLYGVDDPATITQYYKRFKDAHEGMMNCADLLKANFEKGGAKKPHCDAMVYEAISYVENILQERHIIDQKGDILFFFYCHMSDVLTLNKPTAICIIFRDSLFAIVREISHKCF